MNQYSRNRPFPAGNPIANALVVIVGALAIGISFILGVVAIVALGSILLVLAAIIGIRVWWLNRRLARRSPQGRQGAGTGVIEGEFRVIAEERSSEAPEQEIVKKAKKP